MLGADEYTESQSLTDESVLPVFVAMLHANQPEGTSVLVEIASPTNAVAACLGKPGQCVHIEYAPAGAGRIAFGRRLVQ